MAKEELIQFLKDNLKIKTSTVESWETKEIGVSIFLGDEEISTDYFSI